MRSEHVEHNIKEETAVELHPDNMKGEECFHINNSQKSLLQTLKEQKKAFSKEK
jgi:hypothetical protein